MNRGSLKIVVGLGNPGAQYSATRHNVGFMAIDRWVGTRDWKPSSDYLWVRFSEGGNPVVALKPMTFMNLSGVAVKQAAARFGAKVGDILVVHDDMDLPLGTLKMKQHGGSGGHRGVESVIYELGDDRFSRIRVGIGHPVTGNVVDFVLQPFDPAEFQVIEHELPLIVKGIRSWVRVGVRRAMNDFNRTRNLNSFPNGDEGHKEV